MNVILGAIKGVAPFVEVQGYQMHTTARSVLKWKKTEMAVQKLSTLVQPKRIYFMNGKNMDLKSGDIGLIWLIILSV